MLDKSYIIRNYTADTAASIVDVFYNELVSEQDQKLLQIAFAKEVQQAQLDQFLQSWDIEKYGEGKSMLLSYLMKTNPQLQFRNYEKPRLEGLLKYHRFRNLKLISHYSKIVKALNAANIFPMILKGGAMKHIRPELPRPMGDIDILIIDENELLKAREICRSLGYVEEIPDDHSIDLHLPDSTEGTVDLHRYIDFEVKYDKSFLQDLFARATKENVFNTVAFVPCAEDLLFLAMINLARNLHNKTSLQGVLYSLFDFKYLSERGQFNWDQVLQNIVATKTYSQALLAMKFANKIIPDILPKSLIESKQINKKFKRYCDRIVFQHFFFNEFRSRYKSLNIKDALCSWSNFKNYVVNKPKYFFVKRIVRKSHFLLNIFLIINSNKVRNS